MKASAQLNFSTWTIGAARLNRTFELAINLKLRHEFYKFAGDAKPDLVDIRFGIFAGVCQLQHRVCADSVLGSALELVA
jgi:hypothetical protein